MGPPASNRPSDGSLAEGNCFVEFLAEEGDMLLHRVSVVDCGEAHDAEVYGLISLPAGPQQPFPGETAVAQQSASACLAGFQPFVGLEYATSQLRIAVLRPTAGTWGNGDRNVVCSLYDKDLEPLTGTVRASGR